MQFLDPLLIVVHNASTSFTVTPRGFRQLSSLTFFHTSEYILAIAIHGRSVKRNSNLTCDQQALRFSHALGPAGTPHRDYPN
ncbi:unnamed protein product [Brassica rapa]|uniref:Uncharacterized protein n=1 Tax=Brassica campestris TaxID=3711 RepID=A0A8D9D9R7_BRACM|nr:unnamed protein product [Brassica rapa]